MESQKSRLTRLVRLSACGEAVPEMSPEDGERLIRRIAEIAAEQGSPEAVRAWMQERTDRRKPGRGVDWERSTEKIVAMSRVMLADTPEAKEEGWAALKAIGKH